MPMPEAACGISTTIEVPMPRDSEKKSVRMRIIGEVSWNGRRPAARRIVRPVPIEHRTPWITARPGTPHTLDHGTLGITARSGAPHAPEHRTPTMAA
ncbi:hypothetical protein GCM10009625_39730 [Brachybacterium fresconis]